MSHEDEARTVRLPCTDCAELDMTAEECDEWHQAINDANHMYDTEQDAAANEALRGRP